MPTLQFLVTGPHSVGLTSVSEESKELSALPPPIVIINFATSRSIIPELLYDWRFTANQFVLATSPLRLMTRNFIVM
jgi:hypothetical protein